VRTPVPLTSPKSYVIRHYAMGGAGGVAGSQVFSYPITNLIALSLFFLATAPPLDWLPELVSLVLNSIVLSFSLTGLLHDSDMHRRIGLSVPIVEDKPARLGDGRMSFNPPTLRFRVANHVQTRRVRKKVICLQNRNHFSKDVGRGIAKRFGRRHVAIANACRKPEASGTIWVGVPILIGKIQAEQIEVFLHPRFVRRPAYVVVSLLPRSIQHQLGEKLRGVLDWKFIGRMSRVAVRRRSAYLGRSLDNRPDGDGWRVYDLVDRVVLRVAKV
jgi:hypothetical protein